MPSAETGSLRKKCAKLHVFPWNNPKTGLHDLNGYLPTEIPQLWLREHGEQQVAVIITEEDLPPIGSGVAKPFVNHARTYKTALDVFAGRTPLADMKQ